MICYRLHCSEGHEFESWFPNAASYDSQKASGLVSCPYCGVVTVEKSLMAPALARKVESVDLTSATRLERALRVLRSEVETHCDDVGNRFAEEALRRHDENENGEPPPKRGIYGTMSTFERERLEDEGVDFAAIPWINRTDT